ncbi:MAG: SRPBCC domain-containing protein [Bacteroidota bacterium]
MKRTDPPIVVSNTVQGTVETIWAAITQLKLMQHWYFENIDAFEPVVGSRSRFPVQSEDRTFTHLWEVTAVKPLERISYGWQYEEYPGTSVVHFEIDAKVQPATVRIITEVLEDFPEDIPEFRRESCQGGWEYFLGRLKSYLAQGE